MPSFHITGSDSETEIDLINENIGFAERKYPGRTLILCHQNHGTAPYVNEYCFDLLGYTQEECQSFAASGFTALLHPDDAGLLGHYRLKRKDGTFVSVTEERVSLISRNGKSVHFALLTRQRPRTAIPHALLCMLIAATCIFSVACSQKNLPKSGNPVLKGWYADPEAAVFDNQYWIYPTCSDAYEKQVFMDAFSSPDLVNWKKHARIVDSTSVRWVKKAMWAPAVVRKDQKYYLFFAANDIQSNQEYGGIGVAVSDKPEGPFSDLLGHPLIGRFENGAQPIDQFVFKDKDGRYYIIYGGWRHCNIARLKDDFTGLLPWDDGSVYKEITPENYVEGPLMFIKDGKYYFMWSEGGWTGPDYAVAYAISDKLTGPFKRVGKILQQDSTVARGAGHHSMIHNEHSDKWYIVYHRRPLSETAAAHRETCIDYIAFDEQGKIRPVKMTFEGVSDDKLK